MLAFCNLGIIATEQRAMNERSTMSLHVGPVRAVGVWRSFRCLVVLLAVCCVSVVTAPAARAENWPCWRGPRGDGSSLERNVPLHWDGRTGRHVVWKTAVPGEGHASPIVWGERLFTVSCLLETKERLLLCFDRRTGRLLWRRTVITSPLETKHPLNSYASSTPATDGQLVFVTFLEVSGERVPARNVSRPREITAGRIVVAAYDFDGNRKWITRAGQFASVHGFCSSPVLFEDLVIVNGDHDGDSYIVALEKATGRIVWKTPREYKTRSYVVPLIRRIGGVPRLVLSGSKCVAAFDPRTGRRIWKVRGPTDQFVASPLFDGRYFFIVGGFPTYHAMAIRPGGSGDVTDTHVAWHV
ncbi:MAG TPA: hypothetical protein EYP14_02195, partial [Planctomycetaceae bacterium]|nr:hypothetical protein [Planctomycetaceae bacterium]